MCPQSVHNDYFGFATGDDMRCTLCAFPIFTIVVNRSKRSNAADKEYYMPRYKLPATIGAIASVVIISTALWFLHRELTGLSLNAIVSHVRSVSIATLLASVGFAICSYVMLTGYDAAGLRYVGCRVPYLRSALTSFMAFSIGHNVGVAALSGGSIRYRLYTLAGLSALQVARLIVFISVTFGLGASGLLGIALLLLPGTETAVLSVPPGIVKVAGGLLLAVPFVYIAFTFLRRAPVTIGNWRIEVPRPAIAFAQVSIAAIDLMFAAATLYVLLEPSLQIGFFPFLGVYLLAMGAGVISNVPGGIGVFEAILVAAFPQVELSALLGTIVLYRLIYYVAPLILALLLLLAHESQQHGRAIQQSAIKVSAVLSGIAPHVVSMMVFLAGVVLLVSGAMPALDSRLHLISRGIPLPVLELSHMAGSALGMGLLILARGLYRRLHGAYQIALVTLLMGIGVSLIKGLDYEEALLLTGIAIALWISRDEFYRRESVTAQRFSAGWIAAIVLALCCAVWIGLINYRHVEYSTELWWQFAFDADASRLLRASLVATVTALSFAFWKLVHIEKRRLPLVTKPIELDLVRRVLPQATRSSANVAMLGDKQILWSADQQAFIMYQISGDSWIAFGDPVGPASHHEDLAWAFRELVDRHDGRTVFYQVTDESLALYVDLGLTLSKIGEDASVSLRDFSLQGSARAELRQADNRAKKYGATFEVVPRAALASIMTEFRRVSDSWLADKTTAEKGFSLGSYSEEYIANFDCAVVKVDDKIVAFTNLWPAPARGELSVDLMRYDQQAPKGIMDYLFVELMLWGTANGYQSFNLGMAPLAGLEDRPLAPLWHRVGHLIFTHGENFYNFEGLRSYKNKFDPDWQPRYLACPGGWWQLPRALIDASRLISGGITGILHK